MFSSGKSVAAFVIALLVERQLLNYDELVATYWPEFGQMGKEKLTVADILRHEGGLVELAESICLEDIQTKNIKDNSVGKVIEISPPKFPENNMNKDGTPSKRAYHAMTRGLILNEIVRRVDPMERTIGEIIREDLKIPGIRCGLNEDELTLIAHQRQPPLSWTVFYSLFGDKVYLKLKELFRLLIALVIILPKLAFGTNRPLFREKITGAYEFFSQKAMRTGELISANTHASARGLAQIGAALANRGKAPEGCQQLISEETWSKMHGAEKKAADAALSGETLSNVHSPLFILFYVISF